MTAVTKKRIDSSGHRSLFVLMTVETLGEAYSLGWSIHMRCLDNGMEGLKHKRECGLRLTLDLQTLVCTRGRDFPFARIADRLRCPRCGCRRVAVIFGPPKTPQASLRLSAPYRDGREKYE